MKDKKFIFEGVATALITPFLDGRIDFTSFGALIDDQIENGIDAIVVAGTTGESSCLTDGEKLALFEFAVSRAKEKVPVIAGVGCSDSERTAAMCHAACELGCDALLIVTPYYNRPTPSGLYEHYKLCAKRASKPLIAYNVPARTGTNIPIDVLKRLSEEGHIQAIKEASGDLSRIAKIRSECPALTVYSGNDDQTLPVAALGGRGVISVVSNIFPSQMCEIYREFRLGNIDTAASLQSRLIPVISAIFCESNPVPIKYAAYLLDLCPCEYRLPLCEPSEASKEAVRSALELYLGRPI